MLFFVQKSVCLVVSCSKDSTSYTDKGASFFNGYRVVIRHAHGDFLERGYLSEISLFDFLEKSRKGGKLSLDLCFVFGIGGHAHYTSYLYILQLAPVSFFQHGPAFVGREAELGFFLGYVYLEQARNDTSLIIIKEYRQTLLLKWRRSVCL